MLRKVQLNCTFITQFSSNSQKWFALFFFPRLIRILFLAWCTFGTTRPHLRSSRPWPCPLPCPMPAAKTSSSAPSTPTSPWRTAQNTSAWPSTTGKRTCSLHTNNLLSQISSGQFLEHQVSKSPTALLSHIKSTAGSSLLQTCSYCRKYSVV